MDKVGFNIEELVADTIADMQVTAPTHQIKLNPCESFKVFADRDKIGSVISNLISNAIKYSPKGKVITVDCKRVDNMVSVSITDEGIGIAEHDLQSLFDRYYRVNNPMQKHISGFGIGLYLSAEIIRSHEGEIDVSSEVGKGSSFFFKLPISV